MNGYFAWISSTVNTVYRSIMLSLYFYMPESPMCIFFFLPQQFLMSNKLETAMWLSRLFTVYCSVMFILPILGWVHSVSVFMYLHCKKTNQWQQCTAFTSFSFFPDIILFLLPCVFQTLCSSKLLSESLISERPHQCSSSTSKASTLPAEQSFPGPGSSRGQLPLPALLTHPGELLPHHKYPFHLEIHRKTQILVCLQ